MKNTLYRKYCICGKHASFLHHPHSCANKCHPFMEGYSAIIIIITIICIHQGEAQISNMVCYVKEVYFIFYFIYFNPHYFLLSHFDFFQMDLLQYVQPFSRNQTSRAKLIPQGLVSDSLPVPG